MDALFDVGAIDINKCKLIINSDSSLNRNFDASTWPITLKAGTTAHATLELRLGDS